MPDALRRRVLAQIASYQMSGLFSPKQLRTIQALWLERLSLRELARQEGVTVYAMSSRIQRLKNRAARFYSWWCRRNR